MQILDGKLLNFKYMVLFCSMSASIAMPSLAAAQTVNIANLQDYILTYSATATSYDGTTTPFTATFDVYPQYRGQNGSNQGGLPFRYWEGRVNINLGQFTYNANSTTSGDIDFYSTYYDDVLGTNLSNVDGIDFANEFTEKFGGGNGNFFTSFNIRNIPIISPFYYPIFSSPDHFSYKIWDSSANIFGIPLPESLDTIVNIDVTLSDIVETLTLRPASGTGPGPGGTGPGPGGSGTGPGGTGGVVTVPGGTRSDPAKLNISGPISAIQDTIPDVGETEKFFNFNWDGDSIFQSTVTVTFAEGLASNESSYTVQLIDSVGAVVSLFNIADIDLANAAVTGSNGFSLSFRAAGDASNGYQCDLTSIACKLAAGDYTIGLFGTTSVDPELKISFARPVYSTIIPSSVPEPATWLTMLVGFGAVGGALRRRKLTQAELLPATI